MRTGEVKPAERAGAARVARAGRVRAALTALAGHWPEYLIEGWGLGAFMVSAGGFATLLEYPGSPIHQAIASDTLRRVLMAIAMGLTAMSIVYSPWGQRSGAHLNPAITAAYWRMGKVAGWDAVFYVFAQFIGGALGVGLVAACLGAAFGDEPVSYVATRPGSLGPGAALVAEFAMSALMMLAVLSLSRSRGFMRLTGVAAGLLLAAFITFVAPISGTSMNPARSFASAWPAGSWTHLWIYFVAPPLGTLAGAALFQAIAGRHAAQCAKLYHSTRQRCIHCGFQPTEQSARAGSSLSSISRSAT